MSHHNLQNFQQHQFVQGGQMINNSVDRRYSEKFQPPTRFSQSPMIRTPKNSKVVYLNNNQQQMMPNPSILHSQFVGGQPVITTRSSAVHSFHQVQQAEQIPQIIATSSSGHITQLQGHPQFINGEFVQILQSPQPVQIIKSVAQTPPQIMQPKSVMSTSPVLQSGQQQIVSTEVQHLTYNSNDELLIKELEAYKKKCSHLETHILQYKQKFEVIRVTETQMNEVLTENRQLALQINEYLMQITQYKQQIDQLNLRLNQVGMFEAEYKKIQDLYSQQIVYIDQYKNELYLKSNKIQELLHKDEENQRTIQNLMMQLQGLQQQNEENVKRNKRDKANQDKEKQDLIDALSQKLQDKERELQNLLFALSNSENSKMQGDLQLKGFQDSINLLQIDIRSRDDTIKNKNAEIDRLREQINNLQINIYQFQTVDQEKQRLQQAVENKNQEIEQWKRSFADQNARIEELRAQVTNIYIFENQIKNLKHENDGLKNIVDQKEDEVKRSKNRQKDLEKDADEKRGLLYQISQFEAKINLYAQEIEQLKKANQQKQTEVEDYKLKLSQAQSQLYQLQHNETVIININNKVANLENELRAQKEINGKLELEVMNYKNQITESQYNIQILSQEIHNLRNLSNDYNQVRQSVHDNEFKVHQLTVQIQNLNLSLQQKENELDEQRKRSKNSNDENDKLRNQLGELQHIIHQLEMNLNEVNIQLNIYKETQHTITNLHQQIDQLKLLLSEIELKYEELLKRTNYEKEQYENRIVLLSTENQRKDFHLNSKQQEIENYRTQLIQFTEIQIQYRSTQDKVQYLLQEIDRLTAENTQHLHELEEWRFKYAEFSVLEKMVHDLLMRIVLQSAEVEALRESVSRKGQENTNLRNSQLSLYRN